MNAISDADVRLTEGMGVYRDNSLVPKEAVLPLSACCIVANAPIPTFPKSVSLSDGSWVPP